MLILEARRICRSGRPRENTYTTAVIAGKREKIKINCADAPHCTLADIRSGKGSWVVELHRKLSGHKRTLLRIDASNIGLKRFLRIVRSMRPVDLTRRTVHMNSFTNPERTVICTMAHDPERLEDPMRWSSCITGTPEQEGIVRYTGDVITCANGVPFPCVDQFYPANRHPLREGQRSDYGGFRCTANAGAVTCRVRTGEGKGHGFTISPSGVSELSG